ncbi:MAG TPA: 3-oxoacyl-ACP reductase FabG [Saprospiraceae bacterium]|nr:3-oxoacyl-ACP reductase FabG [Saprospiraceae bacterium]MCC6688111.1 3-oxoacyl-ACP reductase FabG [Saprospiraceae bacterium]HMW75889.1 3-oxoacyl-ACP reductase FabG [Saprospiraceae bacterium]HMX81871.1 3-oxoacyl-ACP reductase FabG [Saprospiraceae bacterium]HMX84323.1 3-oxoacyl-ACP reductase FabG [Saprospiraceae bacterium]
MKRLENKIAIVTGGASGIGKATSIKFLQEGAKVIIWDVAEQKALETVKELAQDGSSIEFMKVDTTSFENVQQAAQTVADKYGRLDILVNNAGVTRDATLKNMTEEQWDLVINVNLKGVFNCAKAVMPHMVANNYGRIINAASVVALYGNFGQTNYVATKAGVIGMTKTWARELGRKNITVNAIAPGFIATEMMLTIPENVLQGFKDKTPLARLGNPSEVANVYAFLASEEASFISGTVISVDGGLVI